MYPYFGLPSIVDRRKPREQRAEIWVHEYGQTRFRHRCYGPGNDGSIDVNVIGKQVNSSSCITNDGFTSISNTLIIGLQAVTRPELRNGRLLAIYY